MRLFKTKKLLEDNKTITISERRMYTKREVKTFYYVLSCKKIVQLDLEYNYHKHKLFINRLIKK